ncbi:MAG: sulfatase-like hydrolase/transferase [Muribaculaceae bacterium]|nr:sulfatase-like hydrolase/transferase [Muribaculaceae bacterium]
MKVRFVYLLKIYIAILAIFVMQKPLFMIFNSSSTSTISLTDYLSVLWHGLSLDLSTTSYLFIIPSLLVLLSIYVVSLNYKKILAIYYIIISLLCGIIFVVDTSLYEFWQFKLDATIFFYLQSPENAVASISIWYAVTRILAIILYTAISSYILIRITPTRFDTPKHKFAITSLYVFIFAGIILTIRGGVGMSTSNVGTAYFCDNQFLNHSAVNPAFSLFYSLGKTEDFSQEYRLLDDKEAATIFKSLYGKEQSNSKQDTIIKNEEPNVLLIVLEGFGSNFISELGGKANITPNFNELAREGVLFSQCYGNSFRTDRGTVCALSGHLSYPNTSIMKMPIKSRNLPSIAKSLSANGYFSEFIYGGDINFTNMKSYLLGTGYNKLVSDNNFTIPERTSNAWGVNDDIMFDYLYQHIAKKETTSKWFITFLTLSSHEPFVVPFNKFSDRIENSMAYTDDCIGKFIKRLKETDQWKNLVLIITADHGIYYPVNGKRYQPQFFKIPLLMVGGAVTKTCRYDYAINQSDIAATLLSQLGISHNEFIFSRNVLTKKYQANPFAIYTFMNGFGFLDSTGESVYDNEGGIILEDNDKDNICRAQRIKEGKAILQATYDDLNKR